MLDTSITTSTGLDKNNHPRFCEYEATIIKEEITKLQFERVHTHLGIKRFRLGARTVFDQSVFGPIVAYFLNL